MRQTVNNRGHKRDPFKDSTNDKLRYIKNKEKINEQRRKRYAKDKDRINKVRNTTGKKTYRDQRQSLIKILGGFKCKDCGYDDNILALQIDHIFNTGNLDKKRFGRRDELFRYYISHPLEAIENLQVLCANCNQIRIWEKKTIHA